MLNKIASIILCVLLSGGIVVYNYLGDSKTVPELPRLLDGVVETLEAGVSYLGLDKCFSPYEQLCEIPELDKNYVPQGFCYIDSRNMFVIASYSNENDNSIISLIDSQSGERIKTVKLCNEDSTPNKSHVGGVADIGDSLIISDGKSVRRLKLDDVLNTEDYSYVKFCGKLNTDMQASYLCSFENYLFVGQFYSFTLEGTFDTPEEHRLYTPERKRNYAMCEKLDLTDMDSVFEKGTAKPLLAISMPNGVQGLAFDGETFVTSASYTPHKASRISYYKLKQTDETFNLNGKEVPLIYLVESEADKTVKVPPLVEAIDWYDGKVTGIFESAAEKFDAKIKTPYVCAFE